eukprot:ANDGO_08121.mRNA.1 Origin of replication complex subunit 2
MGDDEDGQAFLSFVRSYYELQKISAPVWNPTLGGCQVDLRRLYFAVQQAGGSDAISAWAGIASQFPLNETCTSGVYWIRKHYLQRLLPFAKKYGIEAGDHRVPLPSFLRPPLESETTAQHSTSSAQGLAACPLAQVAATGKQKSQRGAVVGRASNGDGNESVHNGDGMHGSVEAAHRKTPSKPKSTSPSESEDDELEKKRMVRLEKESRKRLSPPKTVLQSSSRGRIIRPPRHFDSDLSSSSQSEDSAEDVPVDVPSDGVRTPGTKRAKLTKEPATEPKKSSFIKNLPKLKEKKESAYVPPSSATKALVKNDRIGSMSPSSSLKIPAPQPVTPAPSHNRKTTTPVSEPAMKRRKGAAGKIVDSALNQDGEELEENEDIAARIPSEIGSWRFYVDSSEDESEEARVRRAGMTAEDRNEFRYTWVGSPIRRVGNREFFEGIYLAKYKLEIRVGDAVFLRPTPPDVYKYVAFVNHLYRCVKDEKLEKKRPTRHRRKRSLKNSDVDDDENDDDSENANEEDDEPRFAAQWLCGIDDPWFEGKRSTIKTHPLELFETDNVDENLCETILEKIIVHRSGPVNIDWNSIAKLQRDAVTGLKQFFVYRQVSPLTGRISIVYRHPPFDVLYPPKNAAQKQAAYDAAEQVVTQKPVLLYEYNDHKWNFDYFRNHAVTGKVRTSDYTLADMRLASSTLRRKALNIDRPDYRVDSEFQTYLLTQYASTKFSEWAFYMKHCKSNVLLEGYGNKSGLMTLFGERCLRDGHLFSVHGESVTATSLTKSLRAILLYLDPALAAAVDDDEFGARANAHWIIDAINAVLAGEEPDLLDMDAGTMDRDRTPSKRSTRKRLNQPEGLEELPRQGVLYVMVYDLDHENLRKGEIMSLLAILASKENVRMMGSVNHVSAPVLFDHQKASRFRWIHVEATTFGFYDIERRDRGVEAGSIVTTATPDLVDRGIRFILASLTLNQKSVLKLLIETDLSSKLKSGLSFHDLLIQCRERFLVSSETVLRSMLNEFKDHQLIVYRRTSETVETLQVNLTKSMMEELLATWPE